MHIHPPTFSQIYPLENSPWQIRPNQTMYYHHGWNNPSDRLAAKALGHVRAIHPRGELHRLNGADLPAGILQGVYL